MYSIGLWLTGISINFNHISWWNSLFHPVLLHQSWFRRLCALCQCLRWDDQRISWRGEFPVFRIAAPCAGKEKTSGLVRFQLLFDERSWKIRRWTSEIRPCRRLWTMRISEMFRSNSMLFVIYSIIRSLDFGLKKMLNNLNFPML
jgi:hypothetical protein